MRRHIAALLLAVTAVGTFAAFPARASGIASGTITYRQPGTDEPEVAAFAAKGCTPSATDGTSTALINVSPYRGHIVKLTVSSPGTVIPPATVSSLLYTVWKSCSATPSGVGGGTAYSGRPSTFTVLGQVIQIVGDGHHVNQGYTITLVS